MGIPYFGVVIVTYNRLDKLKNALLCYEEQTLCPGYVIVVNNDSTDGTGAFLEEWQNEDCGFRKIVIDTGNNLGGSGGFAIGLKRAIQEKAEWIWIADDDAYPEKDCLAKIRDFVKGKDDISAVCGEVLNPDGSIDLYHRRRFTRKALVVREERIPEEEYESGEAFDVDLYSFVGTAVRWSVLRKVGPNNSDYFIWFDDSEHSMRVRETGRIVCLPDVRIHHDTAAAPVKTGLSWKDYYGVRNCLDAYRKHLPRFDYLGLVLADFAYLWLKVKDPVSKGIMRDGIRDGRAGKLGVNPKYLPGKKIS